MKGNGKSFDCSSLGETYKLLDIIQLATKGPWIMEWDQHIPILNVDVFKVLSMSTDANGERTVIASGLTSNNAKYISTFSTDLSEKLIFCIKDLEEEVLALRSRLNG